MAKFFTLVFVLGLALLNPACKKSIVQPLPKETHSEVELEATFTALYPAIGTTDGANTLTAGFNQLVEALSLNNEKGEISISGCATPPNIAIAMSTVNGKSVATAVLSGGTCADGVSVIATLHLDKVIRQSGGAGQGSKESTYIIDTDIPVATLASPVYGAGLSAINSTGTATLALTLTNTATTSLAVATGTSAVPPAGLNVSTTGGVSCSDVEITAASLTAASISVGGCSGTGTLLIQVASNAAIATSGIGNNPSVQRTVFVINTTPTATLSAASAVVGTINGANVITASFNSLVQDLDAGNANGEFSITGCATPPSVAIVMSVVGGTSVATATLTGGTCANGNTVTVTLHPDTITDVAGNAGVGGSEPTVNYLIDTTVPTASLAAAAYPGTQGAMKLGDTTTLALSYTTAATQSLTVASGTTSASPPTGLSVVESGASCNSLQVLSPSTAGATISLSDCSGDGSITVQVNAGVATSAGGVSSLASTTRTVWVQNTPPTVD